MSNTSSLDFRISMLKHIVFPLTRKLIPVARQQTKKAGLSSRKVQHNKIQAIMTVKNIEFLEQGNPWLKARRNGDFGEGAGIPELLLGLLAWGLTHCVSTL